MPENQLRTSFAYKALLFLISPVVLFYLLHRALKDGGIRYFLQRLGLAYPHIMRNCVLIHCASVGEFNAAKPLLIELCNQYPKNLFVVTTNTPTAAQLVASWNHDNVKHLYFPVDYSFATNNLLKKVKPKCILILETEIWPTFYASAAKLNIPISIINGRLSQKTIDAHEMLKREYRKSLKYLSLLLARSDEDRNNYIKLGANESTSYNLGNLKYATTSLLNKTLPCTTIKQPFILAASTHENEELQIAEHIEILKKYDYLLVIAPRYPDRCAALSQQFESLGHNVILRSSKNQITNLTNIYIVDTLGELDVFFNEAAMVFMGGSLIERGGHNILEPAKFGKCILVGPNTQNFQQETDELLSQNALIQVENNYDLGIKFIHLLKNDSERHQFGARAGNFMKQKNLVLQNYLKHLKPLVNIRVA